MRVFLVVGVTAFLVLYTSDAADIMAGELTLTSPDPTTLMFVRNCPVNVTFELSYTVTDSVTPTDIKVYFKEGAISRTSAAVSAVNGPDGGTELMFGGSFPGLTAELTLDAQGCNSYDQLCVAFTVPAGFDENDSNNEACINFGDSADEAGFKNCSGTCQTDYTDGPGSGGGNGEENSTQDPDSRSGTQIYRSDVIIIIAVAIFAGCHDDDLLRILAA
ncbi:uncharacterized protein [Ptychodera flava]|uniref:uncharacterized protein n=1 Tax=Ptychodera flava TaxID=63121 RepID=UPI00396A43FD